MWYEVGDEVMIELYLCVEDKTDDVRNKTEPNMFWRGRGICSTSMPIWGNTYLKKFVSSAWFCCLFRWVWFVNRKPLWVLNIDATIVKQLCENTFFCDANSGLQDESRIVSDIFWATCMASILAWLQICWCEAMSRRWPSKSHVTVGPMFIFLRARNAVESGRIRFR